MSPRALTWYGSFPPYAPGLLRRAFSRPVPAFWATLQARAPGIEVRIALRILLSIGGDGHS